MPRVSKYWIRKIVKKTEMMTLSPSRRSLAKRLFLKNAKILIFLFLFWWIFILFCENEYFLIFSRKESHSILYRKRRSVVYAKFLPYSETSSFGVYSVFLFSLSVVKSVFLFLLFCGYTILCSDKTECQGGGQKFFVKSVKNMVLVLIFPADGIW